MKTILVLLPLTLALSACNQFGAQNSEFAAMGKGSIIQDSEPSPDTTVVVTDGGSFGGSDGGSTPKEEVVVTDGGSFGGSDGGSTPKEEVVVTDGGSFGGSDGGSAPQKVDEVPVQKTLCQSPGGLKGQLWDASNLSKVAKFDDAVQNGIAIPDPIYMSALDIFRQENQGFKKEDGSYVLNSKGEKLVTHYGLELKSNLTLSDSDPEGLYQIALYGEDQYEVLLDGRVLEQQASSSSLRFFREQGNKLYTFKLEKGKSYPVTIRLSQNKTSLNYALVMMWRKVKELDGAIVNNLAEKDLTEKVLSGNISQTEFDELQVASQERPLPWMVLKPANYSSGNSCP